MTWLLDPKNGLVHIGTGEKYIFPRTLCDEDRRQMAWFMQVTTEDIAHAKGYEYCATCGLLNKEFPTSKSQASGASRVDWRGITTFPHKFITFVAMDQWGKRGRGASHCVHDTTRTGAMGLPSTPDPEPSNITGGVKFFFGTKQ